MTRNIANDASNTDKTTPVDADRWTIIDSETNPNSLKEVTGANKKAWLKAYFDTLYAAISGGVLTLPQINDTSSDHQYVFSVSELTADRTVTLPLLLTNDTFVFAAFIQTLTNKRITARVTTEASSATPTINTDNADIHTITALAAAITSFTTNLSGTPTSGQKLMIEILDNGTARAITWGASFASGPATLPTTTILSKWLYVGFEWSASRSKWICLATGSEQ
jgi:hypothetical protein